MDIQFISGLFLAAHYVLWFESLQYTSVASSTVIVTLQPLFSMIVGYFLFKEIYERSSFWLPHRHFGKYHHWMARFPN